MKMMYVLTIWILANLLHPVIFMLAGIMVEEVGIHSQMIGFALLLFVYSLLLSLPSLLISWCLMTLIGRLHLDTMKKYLIWLFLISFAPVLNVFLIGIFFLKQELGLEELCIALPASIAVILAVLIRAKSFFKLLNSVNTDQHETDMV